MHWLRKEREITQWVRFPSQICNSIPGRSPVLRFSEKPRFHWEETGSPNRKGNRRETRLEHVHHLFAAFFRLYPFKMPGIQILNLRATGLSLWANSCCWLSLKFGIDSDSELSAWTRFATPPLRSSRRHSTQNVIHISKQRVLALFESIDLEGIIIPA